MRKIVTIIFIASVISGVWAGENIEPGLNWLKDNSGTVFVNKSIGTTATKDSIYSRVYNYNVSPGGVLGSYNSLHAVIDSVSGTFSITIDLLESWDGTNFEFTTNLGVILIDGSREDTVFEVNCYPAPFLKLLVRETDASTADSADIDTLTWFNSN